ncbi:unnamed protein product [Heligmosomoides polygyrus]|uniref:UDENN domain-containing protein n=1 Tax=Heligmosomoides polygyrus TaxID=6339 RepID=A0A183FPH3_HELPZ|nr:unnamed protein product [Heligmosomoides polygyrus]
MAAATKDTSFLAQLISRTIHSHSTQGVTAASAMTTEGQQSQPLASSSSDNLNTGSGPAPLYQRVVDWGSREPFFKLALVFHTNNY